MTSSKKNQEQRRAVFNAPVLPVAEDGPLTAQVKPLVEEQSGQCIQDLPLEHQVAAAQQQHRKKKKTNKKTNNANSTSELLQGGWTPQRHHRVQQPHGPHELASPYHVEEHEQQPYYSLADFDRDVMEVSLVFSLSREQIQARFDAAGSLRECAAEAGIETFVLGSFVFYTSVADSDLNLTLAGEFAEDDVLMFESLAASRGAQVMVSFRDVAANRYPVIRLVWPDGDVRCAISLRQLCSARISEHFQEVLYCNNHLRDAIVFLRAVAAEHKMSRMSTHNMLITTTVMATASYICHWFPHLSCTFTSADLIVLYLWLFRTGGGFQASYGCVDLESEFGVPSHPLPDYSSISALIPTDPVALLSAEPDVSERWVVLLPSGEDCAHRCTLVYHWRNALTELSVQLARMIGSCNQQHRHAMLTLLPDLHHQLFPNTSGGETFNEPPSSVYASSANTTAAGPSSSPSRFSGSSSYLTLSSASPESTA